MIIHLDKNNRQDYHNYRYKSHSNTPPKHCNEVDKGAFEEGYNSDGQIGPFVDAVVGKERESYSEEVHNPDSLPVKVEVENCSFNMTDPDIMALNKKDLVNHCV